MIFNCFIQKNIYTEKYIYKFKPSSLTRLELKQNNLIGNAFLLFSHPNLEFVDLNFGNRFTLDANSNTINHQSNSTLQNLQNSTFQTNLKHFVMHDNELRLNQLPEQIGLLSKLTRLGFGDNFIYGT